MSTESIHLHLESPKAVDALQWISEILKKHNVNYQVTGGLAAKVYGATRSLADIDLDLPNSAIDIILPEIKSYLVYGPERYQDEQWDILLLTMDYHGQLIDISGADDGLVFNEEKQKWVKCEVNFAIANRCYINNMPVSVISKNELVKYKSELKREVDLLDLAEIVCNQTEPLL